MIDDQKAAALTEIRAMAAALRRSVGGTYADRLEAAADALSRAGAEAAIEAIPLEWSHDEAMSTAESSFDSYQVYAHGSHMPGRWTTGCDIGRDFPSREAAVEAVNTNYRARALEAVRLATAPPSRPEDGIVGELRGGLTQIGSTWALMRRAADEIARLQSELAAMQADRPDEIDLYRLIQGAPVKTYAGIAKHLAAALAKQEPTAT